MTIEDMRANLFIIGAGKCGTTSLWEQLKSHPEVCMSSSKEPSYFSMSKHWDRGENWYHSLYEDYEGQRIVGEASNSYSATGTFTETVNRIFNYNRNARLIYVVRNPKDRTESDWMEATTRKTISFTEFLQTDPLYLDKNNYKYQYDNYANVFGPKAILVLFFEEMITDFPSAQQKIADFLEIEPVPTSLPQKRTTAGQKRRSALIASFQRSDFYASIRHHVPKKLRSLAIEKTSRNHTISRPVWTQSDMDQFTSVHREQTIAFLKTLGRDTETWSW